jgi:nitrite reductase (NADH) large subunit
MKRYVIIGNGVAGVSAAEQILDRDSQAGITIFSQEQDPFYYRPRLPDFIAGDAQLQKFTLHDSAWYTDQDIDLHLGEKVTQVDTQAREVRTEKGYGTGYDALLLATGAHSFIPPVEGADKKNVFALRSAQDARDIKAASKGAKAAVLVGGGLLGLEAGYGLIRQGLSVQVVEFFDRLLPRQMDVAGAAKLQGILEKMGFSFFLGAKAKQITGNENAGGLLLEDGRELQGGLVLFSAGIRGNVELAQDMGLEIHNGVVVDDYMRTSQAGVWAAGDHIEHNGRLYGIWPAAKEQGEIAGINMAGGDAAYKGTVMSNSLKVVGVDLTSAGEVDAEGRLQAAVYEEEAAYRKIVMEEGQIKGCIFLGLTKGVKECLQAMEHGLQVGHLAPDMRKKDFDFSKLLS